MQCPRLTVRGPRSRRVGAVLAPLATAAVIALAVAPSPALAGDNATRCGNPSRHAAGYMAEVCGIVYTNAGRITGRGTAGCRQDSGSRVYARCAGVQVGVNLYRRTAGGGYVLIHHSNTYSCGRYLPGYPCAPVLNFAETERSWPASDATCYYYQAEGRATVILPVSGVTIPGIRVFSYEWAAPACRA